MVGCMRCASVYILLSFVKKRLLFKLRCSVTAVCIMRLLPFEKNNNNNKKALGSDQMAALTAWKCVCICTE